MASQNWIRSIPMFTIFWALRQFSILSRFPSASFYSDLIVLIFVAMSFHLDGVSKLDQINTNVHYLLGTEAVLYLVAFSLSFLLFPLFWKKSFFSGIQWRGATAIRLFWQLGATAL